MNPKKEFIEIFKEHIHRDGADKLLEYLMSERSDFFHRSGKHKVSW